MPAVIDVTRLSACRALLTGLLAFVLANGVVADTVLKHEAATTRAPQTMTMMTYNIQQLGYPNWLANHFEKPRLQLIPEAIKALSKRPDVLILQEVFTEHSFNFLTNKMADVYPFHTQVAGENCKDPRWNSISGNCRTNFFRGNSGVLIFSRWPIEQRHAYVFHAVRVSQSFDFLARKGVVYAKIQVPSGNPKESKALHVFGTHLQASAAEHDIRLLQLDEMRRFIDGFGIPKEEPIVLGGDFNISSTHKSRFNDLLEHANANVVLPEDGVGSISQSTNEYLRLITGADSKVRPDLTLDYMLYRTDHRQPVNNPKLQVINFKSKTPWLGTKLLKPDIELNDLSDHYPVIIELEFE
ncbi:MAG: phospholipase C [Glaciecola sp.]|jgi:phospholipase C|uniref:sphingomyelin phosphodiesterase n=1 Tax=Congregibacter sp. TaxID=2744308 RepID=UPI0039E65CCD